MRTVKSMMMAPMIKRKKPTTKRTISSAGGSLYIYIKHSNSLHHRFKNNVHKSA